MPKRNSAQERAIDKVLTKLDEVVFPELCACQSELEDCGCKDLWKKLDTITGKVENLMHDLYKATK